EKPETPGGIRGFANRKRLSSAPQPLGSSSDGEYENYPRDQVVAHLRGALSSDWKGGTAPRSPFRAESIREGSVMSTRAGVGHGIRRRHVGARRPGPDASRCAGSAAARPWERADVGHLRSS